MAGLLARGAEPDFAAWSESARLNPAAGAASRGDEPEVANALALMADSIGPALQNFERILGPAPST
jgi:hypothetical protein